MTPLHPMIVHIPLALALLMPLVAAATLAAWWLGWLPGRRVWLVALVLQGVLVGGALAAIETGEDEEERVEAVVGEAALEAHEEAADRFVIAAGVVFGLALLALALPREGLRKALAAATVAGTLVVALLGVNTGKAGGELVYRHGAASVYQQDGAAAPPGAAVERGRESEHEDDD